MNTEELRNESEHRNINDSVLKNSIFTCNCIEQKTIKVTFDGGLSGNYIIEYCQMCFDQDDKQFLINVEQLEEKN